MSVLGFLGFRIQFEFVEKQFAHLTRAVDIESFTRQIIDALLQSIQFLRERLLRLTQFIHIDPHARCLHLTQNRHQRQLHFVIERPEVRIGFERSKIRLLIRIKCHLRVQQILAKSVLNRIERGGSCYGRRISGFRRFLRSRKKIQLVRVCRFGGFRGSS